MKSLIFAMMLVYVHAANATPPAKQHSCFLDDYASANSTGQHWFMHEMVLVWQSAHQMKECQNMAYQR